MNRGCFQRFNNSTIDAGQRSPAKADWQRAPGFRVLSAELQN
jgi:hypothetical protein